MSWEEKSSFRNYMHIYISKVSTFQEPIFSDNAGKFVALNFSFRWLVFLSELWLFFIPLLEFGKFTESLGAVSWRAWKDWAMKMKISQNLSACRLALDIKKQKHAYFTNYNHEGLDIKLVKSSAYPKTLQHPLVKP